MSGDEAGLQLIKFEGVDAYLKREPLSQKAWKLLDEKIRENDILKKYTGTQQQVAFQMQQQMQQQMAAMVLDAASERRANAERQVFSAQMFAKLHQSFRESEARTGQQMAEMQQRCDALEKSEALARRNNVEIQDALETLATRNNAEIQDLQMSQALSSEKLVEMEALSSEQKALSSEQKAQIARHESYIMVEAASPLLQHYISELRAYVAKEAKATDWNALRLSANSSYIASLVETHIKLTANEWATIQAFSLKVKTKKHPGMPLDRDCGLEVLGYLEKKNCPDADIPIAALKNMIKNLPSHPSYKQVDVRVYMPLNK
eukprot:TRINITY_DN2371_c0_g4_i2.p1 TRINITY_DN2371_c0_g4~~TRINITY_DN2371_c0_g4_i2.p1  ORF type:complete len:319 (-),score=65.26 TRINITY_DN2371_c0_g4_i2:9-965(-)